MMFPHLLLFQNSFYVFEIGTAKDCSSLSTHWHKRCRLSGHCAQRCRKLEGAIDGQCRGRWTSKCFCIFDECQVVHWTFMKNAVAFSRPTQTRVT